MRIIVCGAFPDDFSWLFVVFPEKEGGKFQVFSKIFWLLAQFFIKNGVFSSQTIFFVST
ncbi:MAG: hypothetical protein J5873_04010 [Bacteroidales bacterium]|nr:hypothetical protein [Bacteroidales bacterium]